MRKSNMIEDNTKRTTKKVRKKNSVNRFGKKTQKGARIKQLQLKRLKMSVFNCKAACIRQ